MSNSQVNNLIQEGLYFHRQRRLNDAQAIYEKGLKIYPNNLDLLFLMGTVLIDQRSDLYKSLKLLSNAIEINPNFASAYCNRGLAHTILGNLEEALNDFASAITLQPNLELAYLNQGNLLLQLNLIEESLLSYERAIACNQINPHSFYNQGLALQKLNRLDEAIKSYDQAIKNNPNYAEAFANKGEALFLMNKFNEALDSLNTSIKIDPNIAIAYTNRGAVLQKLGHFEAALKDYEISIKLEPQSTIAFSNRGFLLQTINRLDEAIVSLDIAISIDQKNAGAYFNRGNVYKEKGQFKLALKDYEMSYSLNAKDIHSLGMVIYLNMMLCNWTDFNTLEQLAKDIKNIQPFALLAISDSESHIKDCTIQYAQNYYPSKQPLAFHKPSRVREKIKIGYVSGEFRHQATGILIAELIELHDKNRFEIIGFDNGWDDGSDIRKRLNLAFDKIINIANLLDIEAAKLILENKIDILVNLNGYFGKITQGIFSYRPALIQVNYLGFPGTLGSSSIDYIIADSIVIPETSNQYYVEKIAYLPNSYQVNDRKRLISQKIITRAEFGLPNDSFVFCCFNNSYKITPKMFDCWMRILNAVDQSVLWLLGDTNEMRHNIHKEARLRGIDPRRLIFAERLNLPDHLNRHRLANLFLDTTPCNAHTTASDALWAGLPVLTCVGQTFAGRVCASLLSAINLPELITSNLKDYEKKAVMLGKHPEMLDFISKKLANSRLSTPLFDTRTYTKNIEMAYVQMYDNAMLKLGPRNIYVNP